MSSKEFFWEKDFPNCTLLKESKSKKLLVCPLNPDNPNKLYLVKIYFYPSLWQTVKYLFRKSKGQKEFELAQDISKKGIPTIIPQQVKDEKRFGFLKKSLVITEQLQDCLDLEELLLKRRVQDRSLRSRIIKEYGKLARVIHDQGIYQDDFDPNNILYQKKQDGKFQLYFVDFERTKIVKKIFFETRVYSLAKLNRMGRSLKSTDQLRFLKAYLGPQAIKEELIKWVRQIRQEEKNIFLRDQRRAEKKCRSLNDRIGFIKYDHYQGYYRKRYKSHEYYKKQDIVCLIQDLEKVLSAEIREQYLPDLFFDLTVKLDNKEEAFQVYLFQYGGLRHFLKRMIKQSPLISAWKEDNVYLKNRSANFLPVAAIEKKIARNSYQGFLIRKGL